MKVLTRYLISHLLRVGGLCLLGWLSLFAFFDVIRELGALTGDYQFVKMLMFVILTLPGHAYELMPVATLFGGLLALAALSQDSEYTVMRTSGVSLARIVWTLVGTGLLFAAFTIVLGEWVVPASERSAKQLKLAASGKIVEQDLRSGFWAKDGRDFINVRHILPDGTLRGVTVISFDDAHRMTGYLYAGAGHPVQDQVWTLEDVNQTRIASQQVTLSHLANMEWHSILSKDTLSTLLLEPEKMSAKQLWTYMGYLSQNSQDNSRYQVALWSKLFYPLACIPMLILALPFAQGQRRSGGLGMKLFMGVMLGLVFYFFNQLVGSMGKIKGWSPIMSATLPSVVFLLAALLMLWRQEKR
ncbi:LPS export ABC transporter permease LptG [Burkholderiaceae bacterium DAT-1]|nr:LPS export ABC transporter permease LptG [Burkholderiaceae bacterium DAT-1]